MCDEERLLLREKYCVVRAVCIVRSSAGCEYQPCNWVHKEGRERERRREYMLAKSADKNCMLCINKS